MKEPTPPPVADDDPLQRPTRLQQAAHDVADVFDVSPGAHEPLADLARSAGARMHDASRAQRRWVAWLMLLLAIVSGASGTSALAATQGFTQMTPAAIMVVCYLVCFVALTRALRVIPVSIAYAIWSGIGITLVSVIGWVLFEQELNRGELAGIALILAGAVVIQLFSRTTHTS